MSPLPASRRLSTLTSEAATEPATRTRTRTNNRARAENEKTLPVATIWQLPDSLN